MKARTRPHSIAALLDSVLPPVVQVVAETPPQKSNARRSTVITPAITDHARRACRCGRPAEFKEIRNGRPRYRSECTACRQQRRAAHPRIQKPIALPHAVRPRCRVPGCPNAIQTLVIRTPDDDGIKKIAARHPLRDTWVPQTSPATWLGHPWCYRHHRVGDRPVGVVLPPPRHPLASREGFKTGRAHYQAWRNRMRGALGLPQEGRVRFVYTEDDPPQRCYLVSTVARGVRVNALPPVIWWVAWWTSQLPPFGAVIHPDVRDTWPTYASMATATGTTQALIAWVVFELVAGTIAVRGCPVVRIPTSGYIPPVQHILDPETMTWTTPSPTDHAKFASHQWQPPRAVPQPPSQVGVRMPWRLRRTAIPPQPSSPKRWSGTRTQRKSIAELLRDVMPHCVVTP